MNDQAAGGTVRKLRGHMPGWSDQIDQLSTAGGPVLRHLVEQVLTGSGHALVVGPHDWELVDRVVERVDRTTIVLRSSLDAETTAERYRDRPVTVISGDVSAFDVDAPVDVLVALDGLERTVSIEAEAPTWQVVFDRVSARLTSDASVLLAIDNPLSVAELGAIPSREAADDGASWRPDELHDRTRPSSIDAVGALLRGGTVWTAHPSTRRPSLLTHGVGVSEAVIVANNAAPDGVLDRQTVVRNAVIAGRVDELAAGWLLMRAGVEPSASGVVADRGGRVFEIGDHGGVLTRTSLAVGGERDRHGPWIVDGESAPGPMGDGVLLESLLLDACARRDGAAIRELINRLVETLRVQEPTDLQRWVAGRFDNVVAVENGTLHLLDSTLRYDAPLAADDVAVQLLDDFARRLFALGWRHPWPAAIGPAEAAVLMASMAGIVTRAEELGERRWRQQAVDTHWRPARTPVPATVPGALARLADANQALRSKIEWFEQALRQRQIELAQLRAKQSVSPVESPRVRQLEKELAAIRGSTSLRVGQGLLRPVRASAKPFRPLLARARRTVQRR